MRHSWLIILVFFASCVQPLPSPPAPNPIPLPTPGPVPSPSPSPGVWDFSEVVKIAKTANKQALREYQSGWDGLAWSLERGDLIDCPAVATTGELRALIVRFEPIAWQGTAVQGFAPGISQALNAAMIRGLGADDRPLQRGEAANAIRKLAEALK